MATMAHRTQIGHKFRALALMIFIALAAAACGGESATATPAPTQDPTAAPTRASAATTALGEIAALRRGGPGAIYAGRLEDLVGPTGLPGWLEGNVSLSGLQDLAWIYESEYYEGLLAKARFTEPTELVTTGQ